METSSKLHSPAESDPVAPSVSIQERIKLFLKFALVGAVFYYLHRKGLITVESFSKMWASPRTWILCSFFMFANMVLGAFRWQVLLRTQGVELSFREVFKINMVGAFFNIALPGAVSGDVVKGVIVGKKAKENRAGIFGSLIFDRILGVSAMVFVGAFSALLSVLIPWGGHLPTVLLASIGGIGLCVTLFFVYLFLTHEKDPLYSVLRFFTQRNARFASIERLYQGVMGYRAFPKRVLKAIALSVVIHFFLIFTAFFIAEVIAQDSLSIFAVAVMVPIGMLATAIPILPAGVGTGHAAFLGLFKLVGSNQGAEIFSMLVLYQVLVGAVGGLIYLKMLAEKPEKES